MMQINPKTGHDGPYDAPVTVSGGVVLPNWIDYNGHMNVAYYTRAFDDAIDAFLEHELGIGETHVTDSGCGPYALQSSYHYSAEMLEGEKFDVAIRLLDHDAKRLHIFCQMIKPDTGKICASLESLMMNVDHRAKRSAVYPNWLQTRVQTMAASHAVLPTPPEIGALIGIRRK